MSRAARRRQAAVNRAHRWANLAKQFRTLAGNELLDIADRQALRKAAARLDRGDRPLVVLASIRATLARVDRLAAPGGAE